MRWKLRVLFTLVLAGEARVKRDSKISARGLENVETFNSCNMRFGWSIERSKGGIRTRGDVIMSGVYESIIKARHFKCTVSPGLESDPCLQFELLCNPRVSIARIDREKYFGKALYYFTTRRLGDTSNWKIGLLSTLDIKGSRRFKYAIPNLHSGGEWKRRQVATLSIYGTCTRVIRSTLR